VAVRNTKVSLVAEVSGYLAGMEKAAQKTRELGTEAEKLAQKKEAIAALGTGLLAIGAVGAAAVGLAVAKFAEFDEAISSVQAATHETTANMGLLRDAAIDAGGATVYSATEAANAIEELAKAGLSTADILNGGLDGALALAAAGGLEVADAAQQTAIALKQFGLEGGDAGHVADLLAAGAGKAVGDVSDLSAALAQSGLVANQTGLSIEETTGVLAAFADQGLLGSDAGTSLKTMLQSLTPSSKAARDEMERLGISAFDSKGEFIGIAEFAGNYQSALKNLTPEQQAATSKIIFGSDAVRAANVLYGQGAEGIQKYIDQTNDSGYAAETARIKLDNLRGDVEKLGGALDTALIRGGSGANDSLRTLTQSATFLVDTIGGAPQPLLNAGLAVGAVGAAVALAGGAALVGVPKITAFKLSLEALNISSKRAALGVIGVGTAIGVATVAIGFFVARQGDIAATTDELAGTLDQATGATTKYTKAAIARKLSESGAFEAAKRAGVSQKELTNAVLEGGDALDEIQSKITGTNTIGAFFTGTGIAAGNASSEINKVREAVEGSSQAYEDNKAAGVEVEDTTNQVAESMQELAGATDTAGVSLDDLKEAISNFGSAQLDVNSATRAFESAVDDLSASLTENGTSLDVGTEKGRANQAALDDIARSSFELSAATLEQTGSQKAASAAIEDGRAKLIAALGQFGITGKAAEDYADKLGLIPSQIGTAAQLTGVAAAEAALERLTRNRVAQITAQIRSQEAITPAARGAGARATTGGVPKYADGGAIGGIGGPRQDNIPIMASVGEHMLDAQDVARMGGHAGVYAFRDALSRGTLRGFADGGAVQYTPAVYQPPAFSLADLSNSISGVANPDAKGRPIEVHMHNPVVRDLEADFSESAELLRAGG
jgi:TP901 family phage tail tape measure protein